MYVPTHRFSSRLPQLKTPGPGISPQQSWTTLSSLTNTLWGIWVMFFTHQRRIESCFFFFPLLPFPWKCQFAVSTQGRFQCGKKPVRSNMCCFWENNVVVFSSIIWYKAKLGLGPENTAVERELPGTRRGEHLYLKSSPDTANVTKCVCKSNVMYFISALFYINKKGISNFLGDFKTVAHTDIDFHPYPLSVSWPRRRTRWASLWSTVPVNLLAWYGPSPVWAPATWTAERHTAAHPSNTWASFPDPIGQSGYPSNRSTCVFNTHRLSVPLMGPGWVKESRPGSKPSPGTPEKGLDRGRKQISA